jgi:membrane protein implicated in regulation of membrane protease activity
VTLGFAYLILFLAGATVALVSGLLRRAFRPGPARAVAVAHHHWLIEATPLTDLGVSLVTVFGLVAFLIHGFTRLAPPAEVAIGAAAAVAGAFGLPAWMRRSGVRRPLEAGEPATVVRDIPARGFGQIEVVVDGSRVMLAARSEADSAIPAGAKVELVDRRDSVVVVRPSRSDPR